jgi:hypothetical protein
VQRRQRFVADQRYDLSQFDSAIDYIAQEFAAYNKRFFSPSNRVLKNWQIISNGGRSVKVDQSVDSVLFNSQRADHESIIYFKTTDDALTLTLADNATNYVEVQITTEQCAADTVAIWDPLADAGAGAEFTQDVNTGSQELPSLVSNVVGFSGDTDKLPLAIVTTSGGAITLITDARNMLYNSPANWSFGGTRSDKTIASIDDLYNAVTTCIKELKGTAAWFSAPSFSMETLKKFIPNLNQHAITAAGATAATAGVSGEYYMDATLGNQSVTLPAITGADDGIQIMVKKIDASANTVTITGTVEGEVNSVIDNQYTSRTVVARGGIWYWAA